MAIDSSIWIYQFQATMRDKEGRGLVNAHVLGFLRRISKLLFYGIKPVFVFAGLQPNKKGKPPIQQEHAEAVRDRQAAWGKYEHGLEEGARKLFEGRACVSQWDVWRMILRIFRHRNVEFLIAPYNSWAQARLLRVSPPANTSLTPASS